MKQQNKNPVKKFMDQLHKPKQHPDKTKYSRKDKKKGGDANLY